MRTLTARSTSAISLVFGLAIVLIAALQSDPLDEIARTSSIPATVCPKFEDEARATALLP